MGVVVVLRRHDLLIRADPQGLIRHRERARRVRRQAYLFRQAAHVVGEGFLDVRERPLLRVGLERNGVDVRGVLVELPAKVLDGRGDRRRVRHEEERGEVQPVLREGKQAAHGAPVDGAVRPAQRRRGMGRLRHGSGSLRHGEEGTRRGAPGETGGQRCEQAAAIEGLGEHEGLTSLRARRENQWGDSNEVEETPPARDPATHNDADGHPPLDYLKERR